MDEPNRDPTQGSAVEKLHAGGILAECRQGRGWIVWSVRWVFQEEVADCRSGHT